VQQPSLRSLFGRRFARQLVSLTRVYWTSPDAPKGGALLALTATLELATVWGNVLLSEAQRSIFDALQDREMTPFTAAVASFLGLALVFVLVSTYRIYVRQSLEIRWREWLTNHYLKQWYRSQAYIHMELHRRVTDNPDQRISEDVRDYVASALGLSLSLLAAVATLLSFAGILWRLSGEWSFDVAGGQLHVPGLMMWVALGYAIVATWFTHRVGRRLVPIQFDRQRFEADFRFGLVRFRENVEAIALARGEEAERLGALGRFRHVVGNWWQLIRAERNVTLLTGGIGQVNSLVPLLVAAPGFFAGHFKFGSVMQTNIAYGQVSGALAWFVNAYREIALWRAKVERLCSFAEEIEATCAELESRPGLHVKRMHDGEVRLSHVQLARPDGRVLLDGASATIRPGDHVALLGPSGAGKRTLLRAIAGIWPFGRGRIEVPDQARTLFLPERPYLPLGSLRAAVSYPAPEGTFPDERIREALRLLGLGSLADRLDETAPWQQFLSGGEQQRLALTRVLLHEPDWIFLDGATSSLDEETERRVYELLRERLPRSAVVSIADRPAIARHHERHWTLVPRGAAMALQAA
jgi:putative ATP-binding cassette transporter